MCSAIMGIFKSRSAVLIFVYVFCFDIVGAVSGSAGASKGSVYCKQKECKFVPNVLDWKNASAVGTFKDTLLTTGWGILDITAGHASLPGQTDDDIMFAAGFLEGVLTARQMENHYTNMFTTFFPAPVDLKLKAELEAWFLNQREWTDYMVEKHTPHDPFWRHASYVVSQLDGLYDGYISVKSDSKNKTLDRFAINYLNSVGDLLDLLKAIKPESIPDWTKFTPQQAKDYFYSSGHCSALIKMLPGFENIFMSHSSWFVYQATNRIYKHYNFQVSDSYTAAKKMSFSSYPGFLESLDDFYILGSNMVMLQTTNNIFNTSLYKHVSPRSLLAWQRVKMASMMAKNGKEWAEVLSMYNSGTYNNQYMIIDLKLVTPMKPLPDNTLWVAEQIPGLVVAEDLTKILRAGYFPSYNVPFFEEIYNKSGYPEYVKQHGDEFTYQLAPRAEIFRRDQSSVKDMDSMKAIMRYNDYKKDPYSKGNPFGAICSRGDLSTEAPRADGCYDTKVTDFKMAQNFQADIINGPTLGTKLPPFSWTGQFAKVSHVGLPPKYTFPFMTTQPTL